MALQCFKCGQDVVFDSEHIGKNGKKIPLDPATKTPHDCPMREKKVVFSGSTQTEQHDWKEFAEDKDDHGNESYSSPKLPTVSTDKEVFTEYVDHTAKGQSKVKIFSSDNENLLATQYNGWLAENKDKIKVQGGQFQMVIGRFAIALYYEETKQ
jgi:hypothetical protein